MIPQLLAIGLISLLGQVALLRELNVALYGSELVYLLGLGIWLIGTAAGAAWPKTTSAAGSAAITSAGARPANAPSAARLQTLFFLVAVFLPAAVVWTRACRIVLGAVQGAYLPFALQLLALLITLLPVSATLGLLFQWTARRAVADGSTLARAYTIECLGALVGGAAATAALHVRLLNLATALICALLALALARPLSWPLGRATPARRTSTTTNRQPARPRLGWRKLAENRTVVIAWGVVLVAALAFSPVLDRWLTGWTYPGLLATRDTAYGRVTLTGRTGQVAVFQNGALAHETEGTAAEEFVHLAALEHPQPRRVLVLGGGTTGLLPELLKHGPVTVDDVEIDQAAQALILRHLPDDNSAALGSPRVQIWRTDPRRFLRSASAQREESYDLILVGMPEPASGQANRFFTREFFAACAQRLDQGGVIAIRLPGAENLWLPQLVRRTASIQRALREIFPHVLVLPGPMTVVLASPTDLARNPEILVARLRSRGIETRLVTPDYLRYRFTNDRLAQVADQLAAARVPPNRDTRPVCYQYTLMLWLAKFHPVFRSLDPTGAASGAAWLIVIVTGMLLGGLAWLARQRKRWRLVAIAGAAGCAAMSLESILLLAYQARAGVLYQDLGLLLMLMMGGLAAGAWSIDRLADGRSDLFDWDGSLRERWPLPALALGLGVLSGLLGLRLWLLPPPSLFETGVWLLLSGAATAGLFAGASSLAPAQENAVAPLYAADVAGGCVGVLVVSFWLIPLAGLPGTALLVSLLAMIALIVA